MTGGVLAAKWLHILDVHFMLYSSWIGIPVFACMILSLSGLEFPRLKESKLLKYAVDVSYVFFFAQLFTWPICKRLFEPFGGVKNVSVFIKFPVCVLVCFTITVFLHEVIEKPLTKRLERIFL